MSRDPYASVEREVERRQEMRRNAAYAAAALVMAFALWAGIEVCTLLPYLTR